MYAYLILLVISCAALIASQTGFAPPALVIPAGLFAPLLLWLTLRRLGAKPGQNRLGKRQQVIIDGSNVMYWKDGEPRLDSVSEVVAKLSKLGFDPGVIFDANVGYLLTGKHKNDDAMCKLLALPKNSVMVAPRGTPADTMILQAARDLGAQIVTNDRFRDWVDTYPEIKDPGYLIRGRYQQGDLKLLTEA